MNVKFNIATKEDVPGIIELTNECFNEETSLDFAYKKFEETKDDLNNIYIVGKINDKIVAHAKATVIITMYEHMNTFAILNHVCVKNEYRRQNIATKMLDEITKICLTKDVKELKLWSNFFRTAAHACYKNYGFVMDDAGFFTKRIASDGNENK